jgi:hypothetical protein
MRELVRLGCAVAAAFLFITGLLTIADAMSDHPHINEYVRTELIVGGSLLALGILLGSVLLIVVERRR